MKEGKIKSDSSYTSVIPLVWQNCSIRVVIAPTWEWGKRRLTAKRHKGIFWVTEIFRTLILVVVIQLHKLVKDYRAVYLIRMTLTIFKLCLNKSTNKRLLNQVLTKMWNEWNSHSLLVGMKMVWPLWKTV